MNDNLIERLSDRAEFLRVIGNDDIAKLLDEARAAIKKHGGAACTIDVIRLAREAGFKASVGKTDLDGKHHPDVNALSKDVPVEWLERFTALVAAEVAEERAKARGTLMFNPYTGWARDPSDIRSDPHGILLLDQEQQVLAEAIRARKP